MLLTIASYIASTVIPFGVYFGYRKYRRRFIPKFIENPVSGESNSPMGLSVIDYEIPPETEEQYMTRLKTLHPEAFKEYKKYHRNVLLEHDRFINMLILRYRHGEIKVKPNSHVLSFSDGTDIWTSNRYYGFATIYECTSKPELKFSCNEGCVSAYTFMSLVDLDDELRNPSMWRHKHSEYTNNKHKSLRRKILG